MSNSAVPKELDGSKLLEIAKEAADAGAQQLLAHAENLATIQISSKSTATDPVSEADIAAEKAILEVLKQHVPDDGLLGEEGADSVGTTGRRWIIDPLDGTVNYLYGLPQWCVSVACEGLVGVILDPISGDLFEAVKGEGALLNGKPITGRPQATRAETLSHALVMTGFGYDPEVRREQGRIVSQLLPHIRDIRRAGSAALDIAWLAAGRADLYYEFGVKAWDTAAGEVIASEAGLRVQKLPAGDVLPAGVAIGPDHLIRQLLPLLS